MRELSVNELDVVTGGAVSGAIFGGLIAILVGAHEELNDFGRGVGAGLYDSLNKGGVS